MAKLLLYCTKSKKQLFFDKIKQMFMFGLNGKNDKFNSLNGKIVAECDFEVEKIEYKHIHERDKFGILHNESWFEYRGINIGNEEDCDLPNKSCLSVEEIFDYLINKDGYAIHIKNLHIFDKPRELNDYYKFDGIYNDINNWKTIDKAPQNMMYAYDLISELGLSGTYNMYLKKNILISIRPEWLCKILNGEKTIEVRKKVLKEMLNNGESI